jgi:DNA polymerase III subunit delta'
MVFSDIPGLQAEKQRLIKLVNEGRISHAFMFESLPSGLALSMARAFVSYIFCQNKTESDACGICPSCQKVAKSMHPDLHFIYPTEGGKKVLSENWITYWRTFSSTMPFGTLTDWIDLLNDNNEKISQGNIPVDEARRVIQTLQVKSYEGNYKVVIIWCSELLNIAGANALLKMVEEPPEKTLFLFVTYHYEKNLKTIQSRTQRVGIRDLEIDEIKAYLVQNKGLSEDAAHEAALVADGKLNKALSFNDQDDIEDFSWVSNWIRDIYKADIMRLTQSLEGFNELGKDRQKYYMELLLKILRNACIKASGVHELSLLSKRENDFIDKLYPHLNYQNLEAMADIISKAHYCIERNVNASITFLDSSLQLALLIKKK